MRTLKENIYYILFSTLVEFLEKTFENIKHIITNERGDKSGIIYSILHHSIVLGPKKFFDAPTAISIGRGIFSPFILLFKKNQGSSK